MFVPGNVLSTSNVVTTRPVFSYFKYFAILCKYVGLRLYIIKNNNEYAIRNTLTEVIILVVLMGLPLFLDLYQLIVLDPKYFCKIR